jgi:hypothetical protein
MTNYFIFVGVLTVVLVGGGIAVAWALSRFGITAEPQWDEPSSKATVSAGYSAHSFQILFDARDARAFRDIFDAYGTKTLAPFGSVYRFPSQSDANSLLVTMQVFETSPGKVFIRSIEAPFDSANDSWTESASSHALEAARA